MNKDKAIEAWYSLKEGSLSPAEKESLTQFLKEKPSVEKELTEADRLEEKLISATWPEPSSSMDERFQEFLYSEISKKRGIQISLPHWIESSWKVGIAAMLIGGILGYMLKPNQNQELNSIANEMKDLKRMMVMSLIEKPQAQERIRAVNLAGEVIDADMGVVEVLITTLNGDTNMNVRLAALEALIPYGQIPEVRMSLIKSIKNQNSPLVLVALADAMVQIQANEAISAFEEINNLPNTNESVKIKLENTIETLKQI